MTELSPAAQTVLDAFRSSHTGQGCLAAALRAAAEQIEDLYCADLVIDDSDGAVFVLRQLMLIADELEAHVPG